MEDINSIKKEPVKLRARARVWARFWRLKPGDTFFPPNTPDTYRELVIAHKTGPFWFHRQSGRWDFIAPWRRVRTTEFRYRTPFERAAIKEITRHNPFVDLVAPGEFPNGLGDTNRQLLGSADVRTYPIEQTGPSA